MDVIPPTHPLLYHKVTYMSSVLAGVLGDGFGAEGALRFWGAMLRNVMRVTFDM